MSEPTWFKRPGFLAAHTAEKEACLMITVKPSVPQCSSDQALHVARLDAERTYGDLNGYRITLELHADGWHVDYDLIDPTLDGGGPHYVIDSASGAIITKRYEQ
jgi:hypothetical protein